MEEEIFNSTTMKEISTLVRIGKDRISGEKKVQPG
jgi:hypothetical protein